MKLELTDDEVLAVTRLGIAYHTLGDIFLKNEGDPRLLRTAASMVREGADVLDAIAERLDPRHEYLDNH